MIFFIRLGAVYGEATQAMLIKVAISWS